MVSLFCIKFLPMVLTFLPMVLLIGGIDKKIHGYRSSLLFYGVPVGGGIIKSSMKQRSPSRIYCITLFSYTTSSPKSFHIWKMSKRVGWQIPSSRPRGPFLTVLPTKVHGCGVVIIMDEYLHYNLSWNVGMGTNSLAECRYGYKQLGGGKGSR